MNNPYMGNPTKALPFKEGYQGGIKEIVEWIESHPLIKPDENSITQFEPFYQIEQAKLKEFGIT